MSTVETRRGAPPPIQVHGGKPTCANGHLWKNETTRWRYRIRLDRPDRKSAGWERDCLVCKDKSEGRRRRRRISERSYL